MKKFYVKHWIHYNQRWFTNIQTATKHLRKRLIKIYLRISRTDISYVLEKFCFMFGKGVYPYKYMGGSERFDETSLPTKKELYSNMTIESTTYIGYKQGKRVWEKPWITNSRSILQPLCTEKCPVAYRGIRKFQKWVS